MDLSSLIPMPTIVLSILNITSLALRFLWKWAPGLEFLRIPKSLSLYLSKILSLVTNAGYTTFNLSKNFKTTVKYFQDSQYDFSDVTSPHFQQVLLLLMTKERLNRTTITKYSSPVVQKTTQVAKTTWPVTSTWENIGIR